MSDDWIYTKIKDLRILIIAFIRFSIIIILLSHIIKLKYNYNCKPSNNVKKLSLSI